MRIAFVFFVLAGCTSAPAPIHATDYDQTCTQASDCFLIDEGSSCCTGCGNAAINKKDQSRYEAAAQMRRSSCSGTACPAIDCVARDVTCTAGKCALCPTLNCQDSGVQDSGVKDAASD
jgi:hypothetical protein